MKKPLLYIVLACGSSAAFIGWRVHAMKTRVTPQFGVVEDFSWSHARGCKSLIGIAEKVLNNHDAAPNSTLTVFVVGDRTTANEPWQLAQYPIPQDEEVLEGRAEKRERQQALLGDLRNQCRTARRTTISPIFLAVKQAVADLRAHGCKQNSRCALFVDSDLEENVEPSIKRSINTGHRRRISLPSIDNTGIVVTFCGLAVQAGRVELSGKRIRRTISALPGGDDRRSEVWESIFIRQDEVRFEPYCPLSRGPDRSAPVEARSASIGTRATQRR